MIDEKHLQQTITLSINAYYKQESRRKLSIFEFISAQLHYIQKRWWLFQILLLLIMWLVFIQNMGTYYDRVIIALCAPLFAIMIMPELAKNKNSLSTEIESCSIYSLRYIYGARLLLFGMADLILLSIFFFISTSSIQSIDLRIIYEFLVPFNFVCIFLLHMIATFNDSSMIIGLSFIFVFSLSWLAIIANNEIYELISIYLWLGLLLISTIFLFYSIYNVLKKSKEAYSWS